MRSTMHHCSSLPMAATGITSVSWVAQYGMPISAYSRMTASKPMGSRVGAWNRACPWYAAAHCGPEMKYLRRVSGEYAPPQAPMRRSTRACWRLGGMGSMDTIIRSPLENEPPDGGLRAVVPAPRLQPEPDDGFIELSQAGRRRHAKGNRLFRGRGVRVARPCARPGVDVRATAMAGRQPWCSAE